MKASSERRDLEFWDNALKTACGLSTNSSPTTAEFTSGLSHRVIFTTDPENIKAILSTQFNDYGKGESFYREWNEFIGDSIFATDGEPWRHTRQLLRPMFMKERVVDTEIFEKHVQKLIPLLEGSPFLNDRTIVDIVPLFLRYTFDAATDYLLGQGTNNLEDPELRVAEAFKYVLERQSAYFRME